MILLSLYIFNFNLMKIFFFKLLLFALIFKLVDIGLYKVGMMSALNEEYSYASLSRVYSGVVNADIVFLGSSRVSMHINPEIIEKQTGKTAFNLAKDGTNIEQAFFTLEEYLFHNIVPDIVVFDADVTQLDKDKLIFQKNFFRKFQYLSSHTMELFNYPILKKISIWLVPSQTFSNQGIGDLVSGIQYLLTGRKRNYSDVKDFGNWIYVKGAHLKKDVEEFTVSTTPAKFKIDECRKDIYRRLLNLQKKFHFSLVLLETPMLSKLDPDVYKVGRDFFDALSSKNNRIVYLSYFDDNDLLSDKNLWFNAGHLNIQGANVLSSKLAVRLKNLICDFY